MEQNFYSNDDFEKLLKEQADNFRMYPSKRVWHSIYNDLHPDRKWPSIAAGIILITALFLLGYLNNQSANSATAVSQNNIQTNSAALKANNIPATAGNLSPNNTIDYTYNNANVSAEELVVAANKTNTVTASIFTNNNSNSTNYTPSNAGNTEVTAKNGNAKKVLAYTNNLRNKRTNKSRTNKITLTNSITKTTAALANTNTFENDIAIAANTDALNNVALQNTEIVAAEESNIETAQTSSKQPMPVTAVTNDLAQANDAAANINETVTTKITAAKKMLTNEDKSWVEHYALYNKQVRTKWKGRLSSNIYVTPGATFRSLTPNTDFSLTVPVSQTVLPSAVIRNSSETIHYNPGFSFETGAGLSYWAAKNIHIKGGVQVNFTNYSVDVTETNHPVLTTIILNDANSGFPYFEPRASSLANLPGYNNKKAHNQTTQLSIPIGIAFKLAGNSKLEWFAGSTVQPTYVFGGKANVLSADHNNYVSDASLLRKWNINIGAETYIQYKMNGFNLQAGPSLRYQLLSGYIKKYSYNEGLYNLGVKVGIVKNL